jgi:hypothetical protein
MRMRIAPKLLVMLDSALRGFDPMPQSISSRGRLAGPCHILRPLAVALGFLAAGAALAAPDGVVSDSEGQPPRPNLRMELKRPIYQSRDGAAEVVDRSAARRSMTAEERKALRKAIREAYRPKPADSSGN